MANVFVNRDCNFSVSDEEKETLQKACNIIYQLKHRWWIQDTEHCDESDLFWQMCGCEDMFKDGFGITPQK